MFLPLSRRGPRMAADQNWPAPTAAVSLPHAIHLCTHCRDHPAGFWVSRHGDQTVRRPWCLSCCQDLDPARHHIRPFDHQYLR